jgi:phage terminase large subunit GpA-like protein
MPDAAPVISQEDREAVFADVLERWRGILAPRPRLNIWQWADTYRTLARGVSAKSVHGPARYCTADAPHQREPQESFTDPDVVCTVLIMASQIGGKTEMINNCLGYHMHYRPANCVVMYPTIDSAEKYSKKKFMPMVRATEVLEPLLAPARSRDSGNTILIKEYTGGSIFFVGANSTPSLRQASGEVLVGDEIDSNESSAGDEGEPVELLWKRGESFPSCVKILSSTPTIKGASAIWSAFEDSDQRYWFMPCVHCGESIRFEWSMVDWPKDDPERAVMVCPKCAKTINDAQRLAMYHAGAWHPTAPFLGNRGYHLNGLYCPWKCGKGYKNRLHQFAAEHIRAVKKGRESLKVRVNTFFCETWEEEGERIDDTELLKRREDYGPVLPAAALVLTCAVDVQGDRLELAVKGHAPADESWGVQYKVFPGSPLKPNVWADLDRYLLESRWSTEDGRVLNITATCIDMGGAKDKQSFADHVLAFCKPRFARRVFAVKGSNQVAAPLVTGPSRRNRRRCPIYLIGTDTAKGIIVGRLKILEHGPGYMHFPRGEQFGFNENYFSMLTAEEVRTQITRGKARRVWVKTKARNEALDIDVYNTAALAILQPNWNALEKLAAKERDAVKSAPRKTVKQYQLKPPTEGKTNEPDSTTSTEPNQPATAEPAKPAPAKRFRPGRGGWIKRW